jgi:hypothetical protein
VKNLSYNIGCFVCGSELIYLNKYSKLECYYCKNVFESNVACSKGHYICDSCHSISANELILQYCIQSNQTDPIELAIILMRHKSINMHGPEHHFLVPAVLLTAYYNMKNDPVKKKEKLIVAEKRAKNVLGGFCGFYGCCGAAVGTGIFMSLMTEATPLSKDEWQSSNMLTANTLQSIAKAGGPRCCKRDTFIALLETIKYLKEYFHITMNHNSECKCEFSDFNKQCLNNNCKFYNK